MHELSLAHGVVQLLEEQARQQGFRRVRQIWLDIGALACVEQHALRFGLEIATRGTLAEGARIIISEVPAAGWCMACSQPFTATAHDTPCPHCGSWQIQVSAGDEMRVRELEVE